MLGGEISSNLSYSFPRVSEAGHDKFCLSSTLSMRHAENKVVNESDRQKVRAELRMRKAKLFSPNAVYRVTHPRNSGLNFLTRVLSVTFGYARFYIRVGIIFFAPPLLSRRVLCRGDGNAVRESFRESFSFPFRRTTGACDFRRPG